ncbi:protein UPSTREAM OF FLC-like [Camellia sinensis]|uniref:SOSEKI DIX-like domain-containing protein n=1 Tax=Camellia sinensis var. sinensis TaxID=542762 RepID=A0A4S4EDQ4_CAMSN|nr:protein UPSTREAM OF FLC-like [Camellia sinensis]THG14471.1 hypothetical protein TEA_024016 [Camellia sinensis var. sinensis]
MEAQVEGGGRCGSDDSGGSGFGEVRRLHVIYFLSRKGQIEHPHLIRVHHLSRNGVRLHDVKRWLRELRGKDMPESFYWSYKRRYKTGYVWQDLVDEDLITPISDNEYVLKGSEISSTNFDLPSHEEKKDSMENDARDLKWCCKEEIEENKETAMDDDALIKTCCEIEEESPPFGSESDTSTLIDDSMKLEEEKHSEMNEQETQEHTSLELKSCSSSTLLINNKKKKNKSNINVENPVKTLASSPKSKASNMIWNFMKCGAVDTNDSAMVMINRRDKRA